MGQAQIIKAKETTIEPRRRGRPNKPEGPMVDVTMKMPQALKDSLPRTTKGGVDWDWVRDTLRAGVEARKQ